MGLLYDYSHGKCEIANEAIGWAGLLANAAILADMLEIDMQHILEWTYAYTCLNASWRLLLSEVEHAEDIAQWPLKVAMIIDPHVRRL